MIWRINIGDSSRGGDHLIKTRFFAVVSQPGVLTTISPITTISCFAHSPIYLGLRVSLKEKRLETPLNQTEISSLLC